MEFRFVTVDVFTDRQFGGNPVAVVLNADGMSAAQMQQVAAEFNLAETTFVLPARHPQHDAQVRIFTPKAEMPFAGHPNIGTAFALATNPGDTANEASQLVFEEQAGLVEIDLWRDADAVTGAMLSAPATLTVGETLAVDTIAAACGLKPADIEVGSHKPCVTSTGAAFVTVELKSLQALSDARPVTDVFENHIPMHLATGIHLYVKTPHEPADIRARMFAPLFGVLEDSATGSATTNLVGLLARLSPEDSTIVETTIIQGVEMGRPALLHAKAIKLDGGVVETRVGGTCVPVMKGVIDVQ